MGSEKQPEQLMHQQRLQREANYKLYSDTMRKEMKNTKHSLVLKLLVLPLAVMILGMAAMALNIRTNNINSTSGIQGINNVIQNNGISNANKALFNHLSSFSSQKPKSTQQKPNSIAIQQQNQDSPLPKWIAEYAQWHREMRIKFPGDELFTNKDAPKLLVRTCLGICGGLHDRMGQLPWDIYLAMRLKRILLIAWQRPKELEHFLVPPTGNAGIDWTIPKSQKFGFDDIRRVRSEVLELFDHEADRSPDAEFWNVGFEKAMVRAGAPNSSGNSTFQKESQYFGNRILRHRLLGHLDENVLEERLEREGYYKDEDDWKPSDLHKAPTFGAVWELFFRPSPAVRKEIVNAMAEMGLLKDGKKSADNERSSLPPTVPYKAVHCRVRHPKAHPPGQVVKGKFDKYPADKTGLPWVEGGPQRAFALETANKALVCARDIDVIGSSHAASAEPVYFLSDSNDLVKHVAVELANSTYLKLHGSNSSWVNPPLLETVQSQTIVARDTTLENAHIDRQKGRDPPAYYATFVDLYLAMKAKCVVYGIGYYAAFAAKVSGSDCAYLYAKESWGAQVEKNAKICPTHDGGDKTA
jgi:hypothetical protein